MDPKRTFKTSYVRLIEILEKEGKETAVYKEIQTALLEILPIAEANKTIDDVEVEMTEQYPSILGFTIWTKTDIITTRRWNYYSCEDEYIHPETDVKIQIIPKVPYKETELDYKKEGDYFDE